MNEELTTPAPEPTPEPEPTPAPVPEQPPDYEPEALPTAPPMEVISVDELLDRLTQGGDEPEKPEESEEPGESVEGDPGEALAEAPVPDPDPIVLILEEVGGKLIDMIGNLDRIEEHTETMAQTLDHPALTTSFQDYTVTEALLLFLLLAAFLSACARMLRGGFSWLRS